MVKRGTRFGGVVTAALAFAGLLLTGGTAASVSAASAAAKPVLKVLVMGDSYSAGNGAGDYSGPAGCYRSAHNYAQDFATIVRAKPYSQPVSVTNAACSGAVTADFSHSRSGRPPELSYVNSSYSVIFLTIGGNDVDFADVVKYCLIAKTRDGANCNPLLSGAEKLISDGTVRSRITSVLKSIRAKSGQLTKIVLLGYPFLEGDTGYTLRSGHGDKAPIIKVGQRLHAIGVAADALDQSIVKTLNSGYPDRPFEFVSVQKLFDGPPYHGLYAKKNNPNRWMVQPFVDASLATRQTWYHPNPTGWSHEAKLLASDAAIPRHPLTRPAIAPTTLPSAHVGRRYVALLSTADARSGTWHLEGTPPPGLRLYGSDIVGVPAKQEDAGFRVGFTDSFGVTTSALLLIDVLPQVAGTVYAFGNNGAAELGNQQAGCFDGTPTQIPGLSGVAAVASSADTGYALTSSGQVWAWGADESGAVGTGTVDGTSVGLPTPAQVTGLPRIVAISAGWQTGYALDDSGNVWAWGAGDFGELGMGKTVFQKSRPAKIPGLSNVTQISSGWLTAYARESDGSVWAWGDSDDGTIGDGGGDGRFVSSPEKIPGLSGITQISAGSNYDAYALDSAGRVWAWGQNYNGQIGDGTTATARAPVQVKDLPAVVSISAGMAAAHAFTSDGTIYGWGYYGDIGTGQSTDARTPVIVSGYPGITAIEGESAVFGIESDGTVLQWGAPFAPAGTVSYPQNPHVVTGLSGVVTAASGGAGYAVRGDGTVWSWGANDSAELGRGFSCGSRVPVQVAGLTTVTSLAAGGTNAVAARTDGSVWTWGYPEGAGAGDSGSPRRQPGLASVTAVAAGGSAGYALRSDGTVWAWGQNANGQLGDGTTAAADASQQVKGLASIVSISAGAETGYALRSDGTVWAWGYGYNGQLGNGVRYTSGCHCSPTPVRVSGITTAVAVAGGGLAGYALLNDGTIRAWGNNSDGVLGTGNTKSSATPVKVSGIHTATAISAGMGAGYAILADGTGRSWGENFADELGNGVDGQGPGDDDCWCYDTPVKIAGLAKATSVTGDISFITDPGPSASLNGGVTAYAVSSDGRGWSWGCDQAGELGSDSYLALAPRASALTGLTRVVQVAGGEAAGFALVDSPLPGAVAGP